ncbi:MAG: Unknown protein [uncultured Sulfurovum sp.]|uniref:Type II secretion system protein K n=1 Tax=uncultured Sulfurovum sp. TaxID=269237 RepID=A0A6S6U1P2_9BACT|nr:MAG: Unknown protein [uncultured Sulfurovum sp.]
MILLELSFIMDKRKTGIALFITLMVIASIMSIMAVSFSYLEKVQKDAGSTSALIQANLLYGNTIEVLKRFFPAGVDNSDKLTLIYTMPLVLSEAKSGFALNLSCEALMIGVPINWLDPKESPKVPDKNSLAKDVLAYVINIYEIEDPNGLEEMLLEAISGKRLQNIDYEPRLKIQKGIVSRQEFYRILTDYALKYDDIKALNVPWNKYFSFIKVDEKTKIDGNYLSPEFISAAFDVPIEIVQDSWIVGETTLTTFGKENSIIDQRMTNNKIFSNKALNAMHCTQTFAYQERQYGFKFNYIEGRSDNFEFNGQE